LVPFKGASALAMDEETDLVGYKHFMDAIKTFEVNVNERIKNIQDMRSKLERLENVNRKFLQDSLRAFKEKERKDDPRLKGLVEGVKTIFGGR